MVENSLDHYLLSWYPIEARLINKANRTIIFPCPHVSIFWTFWLIPARLDREGQNVWYPNKSVKKAERWGTDVRKRHTKIPQPREDPEVELSTSQSTDPRNSVLHWKESRRGRVGNNYSGKLHEIQKAQLAKGKKNVVSHCSEMLCMLFSQMFLIVVFNTVSLLLAVLSSDRKRFWFMQAWADESLWCLEVFFTQPLEFWGWTELW